MIVDSTKISSLISDESRSLPYEMAYEDIICLGC